MRCLNLINTSLLALLLVTPPMQAASSIKCWTNRDGVRECGNVVPPEYAQKGHQEISTSGTVINSVERAPTAEELAARQQQEEDKQRQAQLLEDKKRRDELLLNTYNTMDEIQLAKKGRIAAINTELKIQTGNLDKAETALRRLYAEAAQEERNGKQVSATLQKDIKKAEKQLDDYKKYVANKEQEKLDLIKRFDDDIERYKEIKASRLGR